MQVKDIINCTDNDGDMNVIICGEVISNQEEYSYFNGKLKDIPECFKNREVIGSGWAFDHYHICIPYLETKELLFVMALSEERHRDNRVKTLGWNDSLTIMSEARKIALHKIINLSGLEKEYQEWKGDCQLEGLDSNDESKVETETTELIQTL